LLQKRNNLKEDIRAANEDISGGYIQYDFVSEYYDYILPYSEDMEFYIKLAKEAKGKILELACGTSRTLIPLAEAGIEVTALDIADKMLEICRTKLEVKNGTVRSRIELLKADMRSFQLNRCYPLVTIPYSSFTYLTEVEDQLSCLKTVYRHLEKGGTFFMSVFNESIEALADKSVFTEFNITPEFTMPDGRKVIRRFRYVNRDFTRQVETKDSIFDVTWPDGRKERLVHRFDMRYFFGFELQHLLTRAGFTDILLHSDYRGTPHKAEVKDGNIIILAKKE
jgi:ubiquinone/menaquinone biosynthesis C-methylase UbiE